MKTLTLVAFLALPTAALAQGYDVAGMQAGLTMLETEVARILADNGFGDVDVQGLALSQIVEISMIADGDQIDRQELEVALTRQ